MKTSAAGRARIREREGEVLHTYYDSQGVLTGGVGHTGRMAPPKLTPGMTITKEMSDAWLEADLAPVEAALNGVLKIPVTQNQFDALASFLFNVGTGWAGVGGHAVASILTRLNAGDVAGAAAAFDLFHKPREIIARRNGEKAQFMMTSAAPIAARNPIAQPSRGPSPAPASATRATEQRKEPTMGNLLGSIASIIEGVITKGTTVASVASAAPSIIEGVFKSIDEAELGFAELGKLVGAIRGGKWQEVPEHITALLAEFREIMINFGIDHDGLNVAASKLAAPQAA